MKKVNRSIRFFEVYAEEIYKHDDKFLSKKLDTWITTNKPTIPTIKKHYRNNIKKGNEIFIKEVKEVRKNYEMELDTYLKYATQK